MSNQVKKGLEIGVLIAALVFCAIDIILDIIGLVYFIEIAISYYYNVGIVEIVGFLIGFIIGLGAIITQVVISSKMLKRIFGVYEQEYSFKKLRISFFVFACIIEFILLIGFFTSGADAFSIISFIIWLAIIVIEACVLAIKNTNQTIGEYSYQNAKKQPINQTFEAKIDQLKYLFNLGVITEEQYQNAVKKVTQEFIDKI